MNGHAGVGDSRGGSEERNTTETPLNSSNLGANDEEVHRLGRKISSSGRFTILAAASSPAISVASSSLALNFEQIDNAGQMQAERTVRFAVGSGEAGEPLRSPSWVYAFERGGSVPTVNDNCGDVDLASTVTAGAGSSNNNTASAHNWKSWRHMETLDHPPIMDFYRNADSLDADYGPLGGTVPSRPSMLELLHGAAVDEELGSLDFPPDRDAEKVSLLENTAPQGPHPHHRAHEQQVHCDEELGTAASGTRPLKSNGGRYVPDLPAIRSGGKVMPSVNAARGAPKFGWMEGVFFRCLLNIFGVMLYLRVSWVAGQAGILLGCAIVLLASLVTTITALSTCAICTNGDVKGGGAYFLISRSLGPEFGGSIGLIFSVANAVGAAMYVVGFAETVRDVLSEHGIELIDGDIWDVRIVGSVTCVLLMSVILIGTGFESKMQMALLAILTLSIADYFVGTLLPLSEEQRRRGLTGYSIATIGENILPAFRDGYGFFTVFAIYFPAATGIMAGANISGDLRDPQKSIPLGTLLAIFVTTAVYLLTVVATGSTCLRDADGVEVGRLSPVPLCASNATCPYGLLNHFQVMELSALWGPLVTAGIFAATLSSALASLVSAPKIFQAVCRDQLFPYIGIFATAYGRYGEPRRAYVLGFVIAMAMVSIGDLNAIAPIISNFFLCSYALINYACFDASFARSPGFRPSFKYYNMWVSLGGALLCVSVMFIISWPTALLTFFLFALLFLYIRQRRPDVNWGSSTQANAYRSALQAVMKLEHTNEHVKTYRPHVLVLSGNPSSRPSLVDFAYNITKGNSLMVCGYVMPSPLCSSSTPDSGTGAGLRRLQHEQLRSWLRRRGVKALVSYAVNTNKRMGAQTLIQAAGLGRLRPNILLIGFKHNWRECPLAEMDEYFGTIQDAFDANMGVAVLKASTATLHGTAGLDFSDSLRLLDLLDVRSNGGVPPAANSTFQSSQLPPTSSPDPQHKAAAVAMVVAKRRSLRRLTSVQRELLLSVNRFQRRVKRGRIDVWWLYDDGGLTLLIPHLLSQPKSYLEGAHLRIFTIATSPSGLEQEQRSMASLLSKFRIEFRNLQVVQDISRMPRRETLDYFNSLISAHATMGNDDQPFITPHELQSQRQRTMRQLRIAELLKQHSVDADLIVLSLPVPRKGVVGSRLYMAWLEAMTRGLPTTLLVRGNQSSVLTFYS